MILSKAFKISNATHLVVTRSICSGYNHMLQFAVFEYWIRLKACQIIIVMHVTVQQSTHHMVIQACQKRGQVWSSVPDPLFRVKCCTQSSNDATFQTPEQTPHYVACAQQALREPTRCATEQWERMCWTWRLSFLMAASCGQLARASAAS